jgi:hypothetical protein
VHPRLLVLALGLACGAALAQSDVEWKEAEAPAPPALQTQKLIAVEVAGSQLRWGVDPASIRIGPDRVVRYVVVGLGEAGAINALYEGLRCDTGEAKVYARQSRDGGWVKSSADWKTVHNNSATRHSLAIARAGACAGEAPNTSAEQIARDLAAPHGEYRFRNEVR